MNWIDRIKNLPEIAKTLDVLLTKLSMIGSTVV